MSWLFGMKPAEPSGMPPDFNPPQPSNQGSASPQGIFSLSPKPIPTYLGAPQKDASGRMAYSFDSTALERAAKAARDLEKFPNAKEALELSRLQELSRQKELEHQTKVISYWKKKEIRRFSASRSTNSSYEIRPKPYS